MRYAGLRVLLLLLSCLAPAIAAAQGPTVAECDARVARDRNDPGAVLCYLAASRSAPGAKDGVARHLQQRLTRNPSDTHSRFALAHVRSAQGLDDAVALFTTAADEYAAARNPLGEVLSRTSLATYLSRHGKVAEAVVAVAAARKVAEANPDPRLVAWVNTVDAWLAYRQLDYGRALRLLEAVGPSVAGTSDNELRSGWMSARGANLWALGRSGEALAQYQEQAAFLSRIGNKYDEASARVNIVLLTSGPARKPLALEAARLARESGNIGVESSAYFYLSGTGSPAEAREFARRSLELAFAARAPEAISRAKSALAQYTLPFDPQEAFRLIDEAIVEARGIGDPNQAVRLRFTKATMRWRSGPRDRAIADSEALVDAVESLRALQPEDELRAQRFAQWRLAYYRFAGHLLAGHLTADAAPGAGDHELAFRTVERMRARMLIDRLDSAGASRGRQDSGVGSSRDAVLARIATANRRLARLEGGGAEHDAALKEVQALEIEAGNLAAQLARADPSFGELHLPRLATLADVREALRPDEALIMFQIADLTDAAGAPFGAWVWTVTRDEVRAVPVQNTGQLASAVEVFLGLIQRRDGSEAVPAARLYDDYLAPALGSLPAPVTKLVIIADEALHRVPFDMLRESPAAAPLGAKFQISLVPSASMWLRWRQQTSPPAAIPALVLADPALPGYSTGAAAERTVGAGLSPLPEARREGTAVARAFGRLSRMYSGSEATEGRLKAAHLTDYRVLHFAAHAVIDDLHPERTAVLLAPGAEGADDGFLQVREIVELPLAGQLVLLSACRTAGGTVVSGEGALGLAHAFFRAGARTVVATLWTVRDADAGRAFTLIADALGRGESVAAAVASARRALAAQGQPAAAWAGLVVMGDGELVPFPGGRDRQLPWWFITSAACALLAAFAWTVQKRRAA